MPKSDIQAIAGSLLMLVMALCTATMGTYLLRHVKALLRKMV